MEWWLIGLGAVAALAIFNIERQVSNIRHDVARLDRKLNLLLKHMNIPEFSFLSERVKEIAQDPKRKIEAIKVYRQETGAGLAEAKEAVEAWINSITVMK
jgi:ribosomal protein L7/L12